MAFLTGGFAVLVFAASPSHPDPSAITAECVTCHGSDSAASQPIYPKLDGQRADYIVQQILDFQAGHRKDPVMSTIAENLDRNSLNMIAGYFSQQPVTIEQTQSTLPAGRGHDLYLEHRCYMCHHPKAQRDVSTLPHGPVIAGQRRDYLVKALQDIKSNKRPADVFDLMHRSLGEASDVDIEAMADYISTHTPVELQH